MANKDNKHKENAAGLFYVDAECIDCDLCRQTAPVNFTRNEKAGYSYVSRQPFSVEEQAVCLEAMQECPIEAIGNDGV